MSKRKPSDIATSVRQRLLNRIRETGEDADLVWLRHAVERLLYCLSAWNCGRDFAFKGAALFLVWRGQPHWPTLDVDMLSRGEDSSEYVENVSPKCVRLR